MKSFKRRQSILKIASLIIKRSFFFFALSSSARQKEKLYTKQSPSQSSHTTLLYGEKQNKPHLIFGTKVLHNTDTSYDELTKNDFSEHITRPLYDKKTIGKPEIYKKLWGDFYRDEYSKDIRLPIINLDSLFGGVKVLRKGDKFWVMTFITLLLLFDFSIYPQPQIPLFPDPAIKKNNKTKFRLGKFQI